MPRPLGLIAVLMPTTSPVQVEERAAAVAGVDRGVGLDEVVVGPGADGAILGADDAHRDRVAEAEGVADGDDVLADAQLLARAERRSGQIFGTLELEHREIEPLVAAHDLRVENSRSSASLTFTCVGVFDDVRVGDDVPGGVDEEARAERLLLLHLIATALATAVRRPWQKANGSKPKGKPCHHCAGCAARGSR